MVEKGDRVTLTLSHKNSSVRLIVLEVGGMLGVWVSGCLWVVCVVSNSLCSLLYHYFARLSFSIPFFISFILKTIDRHTIKLGTNASVTRSSDRVSIFEEVIRSIESAEKTVLIKVSTMQLNAYSTLYFNC